MGNCIAGKIKVLFFIHRSEITGPGRILSGIIKNIDKDKFTCDVICPSHGPMVDEFRRYGAHVMDFRADKIKDPRYISSLYKEIKKNRYHILHIQSGQYSAFWKIAGRFLGIPVIVYTEHLCGDKHEWIKNRGHLALHLFLHPIWNSMVDKVVAVSNAARLSVMKRQGMSSDKVCTIYNGIDIDAVLAAAPSRDDIRQKYRIPSKSIVVGMVGRLTPEKGQVFFIRAAADILSSRPDTRFLIVGLGDERASLEKLVSELGIKEAVTFTGFYPEVIDVLGCMDIVVQPSLEISESFGLSLAEAMALAKPVVASRIECFKEIIKDGYNGLLFEPANYKDLAEKIKLLINDGALRARLGNAAKDTIKEKFDAKSMATTIANLYRSELASKGYLGA